MKNKFSIAMSLAVILSMLLTSLVLADNVQNDVAANPGSDTITAGGSTTVSYRIAANNGDGENGCNATPGSPATVTIMKPAAVTVTPASLTFTACGVFQPVTFTASATGDYPISVSVSDSGAGTYNINPANFTLHVIAPPPPSDTTAPVIELLVTGTLGNNGWYTSDVSVSWNVTDPESTFTSTGCDTTNITADTAGTTLTCSATSAGGTSSQSVTIKRDATAPTISGSAAPAPNGAGWNNTDVAVSFTCNDNLSGIASCGPDATLSTEGAAQSVSGTAVDNAGNSAGTSVGPINLDKTAPTISASINPAAAGTGWYNSTTGAPTVSFSCNDTGGSGLAGSCPSAVTLGEGADQSVSGGPVSDIAGNSSGTATISNIDVDLTAPTVALVGGPANGASYYFGSVPAAPTCSASDSLSGLAGACSVSGYSTAVGSHTVTASASDNAGNSASASATYTVLAWTLNGFYNPVDMNGVYNTVRGGSTVPLKFEVFAGSTELTTTSVVASFTQTRIACDGTAPQDDIEITTTGGTSLRYDTTGGQFIQNWQTPRQAGACYRVTMTTQDGSSLVAFFKLK